MRTAACTPCVPDPNDPDCPICRDVEPGPLVTMTADFVLVGLGTAGSVLARELSDVAGVSVLVLEAGQDQRDNPLVQSNDYTGITAVPQYHWHFQGVPLPITGAFLTIDYTEGLMWGGSSAHNFMLTIRPSPNLLGEWATITGDDRWGYDAQLPAMLYFEKYTALANGVVDTAQRGTTGQLQITQLGPVRGYPNVSPVSPYVTNLAISTYTPDYNDPTAAGGVYGIGDPQSYIEAVSPYNRSYPVSGYLPASILGADGYGRGSRQLRVVSGAIATSILWDDQVSPESGDPLLARGIVATWEGKLVHAFANKRVILCAGTVGDATLLIHSGIGPEALLAELGIEPRLINENVGRNVQNHYGPLTLMAAPDGDDFAAVALAGSDTPPVDGPREEEYVIGANAAGGIPGVVVAIGWMLRPAPVGVISPLSPTSPTNVRIEMNEFADSGDQATIVRILKRMGDYSIALTGTLPIAPAPALFPLAEYGAYGGLAADDSELLAYAANPLNNVITNHNSGSCRMAATDVDGVVDSTLDVFGVKGRSLSICSNATVPSIIDGNTEYSALLMGFAKSKIERARLGQPVSY